ncbi:peptidoglycan recognition protein family protein [Candidatus Parcubacteria bacterium]|nr:peptidoglycan recognition protein family protein [Candidatus Parcubacteria bacterium]
MQKLFIVLHHTADPSQAPQFDKVNASHAKRGFPKSSKGYYVGYHWFIGYDGSVKQAREESEVGAHCPTKMMNYVGIGICLAGDFTRHKPNPLQIEKLASLVTAVQKRWNIPDESILLHRECKPTACPGIDLRAELLRAKQKQMSNWPQVQPAPSETLKRRLSRRLARMIRGS